MKRLRPFLALLTAAAALRAAEPAPAAAFEQEIAALTAGPHVTVVHLWAPWCGNCRAELAPEGWTRFIGANAAVRFVFVNVWHAGDDGAGVLAKAGLGPQPNFVARLHPNGARRGADRLTRFLDLPLTWIPTTWVFKEGRLRYALNYGEVRFPMLQQMIDDSRDPWAR